MRYPLAFTIAQARHRAAMLRRGGRRFPTVLMLEPLYTCNMACIGCAAERHVGKLSDRLTVERCMAASDACGAAIVNICGGEPTLYPELPELVAAIIARGRHVICCTNALRLHDRVYGVIPPSRRLHLMIHLDGMRETHDHVCGRAGVFDNAVEAIRRGKALGYTVMINTTVYRETQVAEVEELCKLARSLRADGLLISPGYEFETAREDVFLSRSDTHAKFRQIAAFSVRYKINVTPSYLDFACGKIELECAPWSTVNYTPNGWKAPCYLVGEAYHESWDEFWNTTDWPYWEARRDARCANCMMHSGFEHNAVERSMATLGGQLRLAAWTFSK